MDLQASATEGVAPLVLPNIAAESTPQGYGRGDGYLTIVTYKLHFSMFEIRETDPYKAWFVTAKSRIDIRVRPLSLGNPGDVKPVGNGVSELRIDYGPVYRVYYTQRDLTIVLLLVSVLKTS
jgi:putative addiction module killer protein